jgi:Haem-degrading
MKIQHWVVLGATSLGVSLAPGLAVADGNSICSSLPSQATLESALDAAVGVTGNGGLGFDMWGTIVANDGTVCAVAFSGAAYTSQWLGSRAISAQKANTANDFSLGKDGRKGAFALSTANLYSAVQPGGSLYGLQHSNPVDPEVAYKGQATLFGTRNDPMVGDRVGGVNVFGGGLALYASGGVKVGGVGVSGDTSCTDHMVAWRVRHTLTLDHLGTVGGVSGDATHPDDIIFDIKPNPDGGTGISAGGFGHPTCLNPPDLTTLPPVRNP